jgi:signal transduction histidine kinase
MRHQLSPPQRTALIYLAVSATWILLSDRVIEFIAGSEEQITGLQSIKGVVFVSVTSLLIYVLVNRDYKKAQQKQEQLETLSAELETRVAERTAELEAANEHLVELDWIKSKLIADISHEIRSPMTSINLRLDMLERVDATRRGEYITGLHQQVNQLHDMIEDVLDISRMEGIDSKRSLAPVDLAAILSAVVDAQMPVAETAGLTLQLQAASALPPVMGRRSQLMRLASNLVSNAIKYTRQGSIQVRLQREGDNALIQVEDTGIGIDAEDINHLFDRFYRGRQAEASSISGTGLGLSIVKEIVDFHHGRITVESRGASAAPSAFGCR